MPRTRCTLADQNSRHFQPLDGLRGVAILLILLVHAFRFQGASKVGIVLREITRCGWVGVSLFFVLSGFLITGILLDTQGRPNALRDFYARRGLRIIPLYVLFLASYFFLVPAIPSLAGRLPQPGAETRIYYAGYLANMIDWFCPTEPGVAPLAPLWSLSVEEQVYLIWPICIACIPRRLLGRFLVLTMMGSLGWRVAACLGGYSINSAYALAPSALDAFSAGGIVAWVMRQPEGLARLKRVCPGLLRASGFSLLWMVGVLGHFKFWQAPLPILTVGLSLLSALFASLIGLSLVGGRSELNRVLSHGLLRSFGRYSYAIYLFHESIYALVVSATREPELGLKSFGVLPLALLNFAIVVGCSYVLAWISWRVWESPFLRLKVYFPCTGRGLAVGDEPQDDHTQIRRDTAQTAIHPVHVQGTVIHEKTRHRSDQSLI